MQKAMQMQNAYYMEQHKPISFLSVFGFSFSNLSDTRLIREYFDFILNTHHLYTVVCTFCTALESSTLEGIK